ncbi:MAG: bifunctional 5,10-methylenetetrahydrofolate dehydrogenase/5,10-methenyltetrahydrofolate cyclohydrolase [Candidatus Saccharimonadales bacterium]
MKLLSGAELVGYIKERQARQVRALRQAHSVFPKLAIVQTIDDPVIDTYVRLKKGYGSDILIDVAVHKVAQSEARDVIDQLNADALVHAIIVQLPLADTAQTDEVVNRVAPSKDVDGLAADSLFDPATALAINWLCAGYNIDLVKQSILIVGQGRLVGAPLTKMWRDSGYTVVTADRSTDNLTQLCHEASLIVAGAGSPGLITSHMVRPDTILIDAGTASEGGKIVGDIAPDIYARDDLKITPQKGGVGPLTVAALFDNVIRAATRVSASL